MPKGKGYGSKKRVAFPKDIGAARVAEGDRQKGFKRAGSGAKKIKG